MENAKTLAELVDNKLARHYELDDSGTKKVRSVLSEECWYNQQAQGGKGTSKHITVFLWWQDMILNAPKTLPWTN